MRSAHREELVHYAGASHRDDVAWAMAFYWLQTPEATESVLKSKALKLAWGMDLTPDDIRAANPGMA
jgi:hypothetical protein